MSTKSITVTALVPIETSGKVFTVCYQIDGQKGSAKAFATNRDGSPTFVEGEVCEVVFEKKSNEYNGKTTEEVWVSKPKPAGGFKGGGGMKADPAKLDLEKQKLELDKVKWDGFKAKWENDNDRECARQSFIMAQTTLNRAVDLEVYNATQEGRQADMNHVAAYANDLASLLEVISVQIHAAITPDKAGGR